MIFHMFSPWPEDDLYLFLGQEVKGQGQILFLNFELRTLWFVAAWGICPFRKV